MDRVRVLTLNIWNRSSPWPARAALIRRGLRDLAPDLVGLQEVMSLDPSCDARLEASSGPPLDEGEPAAQIDQAAELAAGLGYHHALAPAWHIGGGLHMGNALLSRWPIHAARVVPLPAAPDDDMARSALAAIVDGPRGRMPVFVTHLNWRFHETAVRCRQLRALVADLERAHPPSDPHFPPILMGDLNAEPDSDEVRYLRGHHALDGHGVHLADCWAVAGDGTRGDTFCRRNTHAAPNREPDRRIDYIFVRGPDRDGRGEPLTCRVVLDQPDDGIFPSDHFGVLAEISTR